MSQKEQQERGKLSLQRCIGEVVQPNGSNTDGEPVVEADHASFDIISSHTNFRRNPNVIGNPLANGLLTPISSGGEHDNFQQRNCTTFNGGANNPLPRHPLYQCYDSRLMSYATWRQFQQFDTSALADAGFYNIGVENGIVIRCFSCAIEVINPAYNDNLLTEHIKKSPNCGYLMKKLGTHNIIAYQERIRVGAQNLLQTDGYAIETLSASYRSPVSWSTSDHIRSPQYQAYSVRLASFASWPSGIRQRPEEVAAAGFYHTGLEDVVRCFACDGGMKNWEPDDEPWIEHARWFPQCPFVKRVKGQEFIDLVRRMTEESDEEEEAVVNSNFQPNNPMADMPTMRNERNPQTDQANESSVLETDAARSVLETGYSCAAVAQAINKLLTKGQTEYKADHILNAIFEMESSGQLLSAYDEDTDSRPGTGRDNEIIGPLSSNSVNVTSTRSVLALQQENERLRQNIQCVSCRKSQRCIFLLPCTHFCLCSICAETSSICPLCYKRIKEKIKTYMI